MKGWPSFEIYIARWVERDNGAGRKWSRISWSGNSKEYGPAIIGFLFTEVGEGKVLTVTYWISKKDSDKSLETLGKIFSSVKTIK